MSELVRDKTRIVVVDDHAIMRDVIRVLLSVHDGLEVVGEASEGREAVQKVGELEPELVLMDIAMPGMDGLEATRRIVRKSPATKVLMLTQYDDKEHVLAAIKAGAAGYIPKRAASSQLVSAINSAREGEPFLYPSAAAVLIEDYLRHAPSDQYDHLTGREREILKLIAEGRTSREIAHILSISLKTVLGHRAKLMQKLNIHNHTQLVKYAIRKGLAGTNP